MRRLKNLEKNYQKLILKNRKEFKMSKEKAKRWTVREARKALREGDVRACIDLATRFPLFALATDEEILDEITLMTARQVEIRMKKRLLKGESVDDDIADNEEVEDEIVRVDDVRHLVPKSDKIEGIADELSKMQENSGNKDTKEVEPEKEEVEEVETEVIENKKVNEEDLDDLFDELEN